MLVHSFIYWRRVQIHSCHSTHSWYAWSLSWMPGMAIVLLARAHMGTKGCRVSQENIAHTIAPPSLAQTIDTWEAWAVVLQKKISESADQATFFQSSVIQFWRPCEHCRLSFLCLGDRSGARCSPLRLKMGRLRKWMWRGPHSYLYQTTLIGVHYLEMIMTNMVRPRWTKVFSFSQRKSSLLFFYCPI